jgi:GTP-binding protein
VDTKKENEHGKYVFIDTAGIRRQSKVEDRVEKFSVLRAKMAVERAQVCLIMIDATEGVTEQDEKIAGLAHEAGKASIFVINKWDAVEKDNSTVNEFTKEVYRHFAYMDYAPVLFVSAKTGLRVDKIYELINYVNMQNAMRISTGMLNDMLSDAVSRVQPPSDKGRYLKLYYMTQVETRPPQFVIFCNNSELFHFSYRRYIENRLRETFGFKGTPIRLIIRQKGDNADNV